MPTIWAWRHPRPRGGEGRCIGRTDLPLDRRRAKRLARRIQRAARRHDLPRVVHSSPLRRCSDVGRWLRAWGWRHVVDTRLAEVDFGRWDGQPWSAIPRDEVDAWCADFFAHAPSGGEPLTALFERVRGWSPLVGSGEGPAVIVAHAGWMLARRWFSQHGERPPQASEWPVAPRYGELWRY